MAFVALGDAKVRYRLANADKTVTKYVYSVRNREDSTAITDPRQQNKLPAMQHPAGSYGDKIFIEIMTTTSGKDGIDEGTSSLQLPIRVMTEGTNFVENRMLVKSDFSMSDIASGVLTNARWVEAWSYTILAGEQCKFGFQSHLEENSREYTNLSDDTGS